MMQSDSSNNIHDINNLFKELMEKMDLSDNDIDEEKFEDMMKNFMDSSKNNFEDVMKEMDISGLGDDFIEMMKNMEEFKFNNNEDLSNNNKPSGKSIPNPDDLQDHLKSLMGGKIGQLAQEIADDTAKDLDIDTDDVSNVNDVFAKLFKNPGKLMNMIKKVSSKLDEKLKSGELNETELMKEASDLVDKMKNTPGMKNMESMLNKMGLGGMGGNKGGKVNMNLFQSMMKKNIKKTSQRDRMLKKLKERQLEKHIKQELEKKMKQENQRLQNNKVQQSKPNDNDDFDEYIQKSFNIGNSVIKKSKIRKNRKGKNKNKNRKKNKK